ncbi:hypothetical protein ACFE04_003364 [Oxalis oulophora]
MNEFNCRSGSSDSSWTELTQDCLINILSRLTLAQRWTGPVHVCKHWLNACKDPSLNTVFDLDIFDSTPESTYWCTPEFERKMDVMLRSVVVWSCGNDVHSPISVIRTRFCSDFSINLVADRCPNLEVLAIKSSQNVTDVSMTNIAYKCPKITELDVSACHKLSNKSLAFIGQNCPNLKVLNVCLQESDAEAATGIWKFMPNLEHLEIRSTGLTAQRLNSICEKCPKLKSVDFPYVQLTTNSYGLICGILTRKINLVKVRLRIDGMPDTCLQRKARSAGGYSSWRHAPI